MRCPCWGLFAGAHYTLLLSPLPQNPLLYGWNWLAQPLVPQQTPCPGGCAADAAPPLPCGQPKRLAPNSC